MAITPLLSHPDDRRNLIDTKSIAGLKSLFPVATAKYDIHLKDVKVHNKEFSMADMKQALLEGKTLSYPVTGTLTMKDKEGKVFDEVKNFRLLSVPYFTDQHTFIVDGNSYSVGSQLRTKPGIYTRVRRNEVPEVAFNLEKGSNFKVTMDPATSIFHIEHGSSSVALYPVLRALGVADPALEKTWGKEILGKNADISKAETDTAIGKIYDKMVPMKERNATHTADDKIAKIKNYFDTTKVDPETTHLTLGKAYDKIGGETILTASDKLLKVFNSETEHDDRDSLEFQKIHSVDDFFKERLLKGGPEIIRKIKYKADAKKDIQSIRDILPASPFSQTVKSLITQFALSRPPDQINPLEILDAAAKVTRLGEGGIENLRAIPDETRDLHPTHLGVLDPVRTPETGAIGVDVRTAMATAKDDDGNIYTPARNTTTGKIEHVNVKDLRRKTIAFPNQKLTGMVEAIKDGKVQKVHGKDVDYQIPNPQFMFGPSASLIPFIDNIQGNRALMGSKHLTQALPLKDREAPMVRVSAPPGSTYSDMNELMGSYIVKRSVEDGVVHKVTDDHVIIKGKSGETQKISYARDFPLNSKTYLDEKVLVKEGDKVKKDQRLTESNFTRDGAVALGLNAYVAYMPYHGENSNDAVVISEGAAKRFTSMHMYKKIMESDVDTILDKKFYATQLPGKFPVAQFQGLDERGVVKKGTKVHFGEPIILALRRSQPTQTDVMLGRLHKSLINKYRDYSLTWEHEHPGEVIDVITTGSRIAVTVRMEAPVVVGDKLSGSYGNKGVVSRILPDAHMPHDDKGKPFDILLASTGVVSRINPGQLLETALGKVSKKTGKTIIVENFSGDDKLKVTKDILAKHNVSDKETVHDPITGRAIPNIFTGYQHTYKLFKSTDTNFGARGTGTYDINEQPVRGGTEGSKRLGGMEVNALLAHGATNILREAVGLKSQKNIDWWNAFKTGAPLPPIKRAFAVDKLKAMLTGAGIKVDHRDNKVHLTPLTDKDITKMSNGTITDSTVLRKKDLKPEIGGLFDPTKTGGLEGEKWSDIKLAEPIVKPLFMKPTASLLRMSETGLKDLFLKKGGKHIQNLLGEINLKTLRKETIDETKKATGQKLDSAVKRLKYLDGLDKAGLNPADAYTGQHLAVIPPKMRPVVPGPNNQLLVADANHLYRDVLLADKKLQEMKHAGITHENDLHPMRQEVYESAAALAGISDPTSFKLKQQGKKGFIKQIAGPRPSEGYFQERIHGRPQDLSGRGTIAPDPNLKLDQIGLPEDTAWGMYKPFVVKRLVHLGHPALEAAEHAEKQTPVARQALETEIKERPVIFNRAPTLWRYGIMAAYPKLIPGKTIRLNPFVETPLGADYDGDAVQLHVPVMPGAVADAKKMTLDKLLFSDKTRNDLIPKPEMEAVIGLFEATRLGSTGKKFKFKNKDEAMHAYYAGKLKPNDDVEIG